MWPSAVESGIYVSGAGRAGRRMERQISRGQVCAAWVAAALCAASSRVALAQSAGEGASPRQARLELEWSAVPGCEERERTLQAVERLLGASPHPGGTEALEAFAGVTRTGNGGWHLFLSVRHGEQSLTRKLDAVSCSELVDAAALILALALDPDLLSRARPEKAEQSAHAEPEPQQVPPEPKPGPAFRSPPRPRPAPARNPASTASRERTVPLLELGPLLAVGAIPSPAFGASISGGFERGRWRVLVSGAFFPSVRKNVAGSNASAAFELRSLAAVVCWVAPVSSSWGLGPCAATEFGSIAARGEGVDFPQGETKRWGASGAGAVARLASRRAFEVGLQGILAVPWGRPVFRVAAVEAYRPAALLLELRAFAGVRF